MSSIKTKRRQGKINQDLVLQGLRKGMKKKDISVFAGSTAVTDQAKVNAVNQIMKSSEFQKRMHKQIIKADDALTQEKMEATNAVGLASIIEKLSKVSGISTHQAEEGISFNVEKMLVNFGVKE